MRRASKAAAVAAAAVAAASVAMVLAYPAAAGGGCHRDARDGQTEGRGTTVEMKDNCFGPTVLRVEPGTEVAFVNRDVSVHRVDGVGWGGSVALAEGAFVTQRFSSPGTYPFTCMLHPGMNGAIVVGDGHGTGPVVEVAPVQLAASNTSAQKLATNADIDRASASRSTTTKIVVVSATVALGAFVLGRARGRRRVESKPVRTSAE